jgi:hypothetical protein
MAIFLEEDLEASLERVSRLVKKTSTELAANAEMPAAHVTVNETRA